MSVFRFDKNSAPTKDQRERYMIGEIDEKLDAWAKEQITRGNMDNYVYDRVWDLEAREVTTMFGDMIEEMISEGHFDAAVKARAENL